jgi:tetratricopeptide (TPR) repeat protein
MKSIKRLGNTITALLVLLLTMASMAMAQQLAQMAMAQQLAQMAIAQQQPTPEMSYKQAQRAIMTAVQYARVVGGWTTPPLDQGSVRLTQGTLEFDAKGEHFTIPLKGLRKVTAYCHEIACFVIEEGNKKNSSFLTNYNAKKRGLELPFGSEAGKVCSKAQNHDECMNAAAQFAAALNSLHIYALRPTPPDEDFHKQATAWRALAEKPALPDAVRVRRMMAEDALKSKKPEDALRYYEQGIESYPMWPEGWFNAALVAGELGRYSDAADYMQNYLELVPDAKDAQTARDQLEIWKIKAQEKK